MFLFEMTQTRGERIPLYAAIQPHGKYLLFQLCWTSRVTGLTMKISVRNRHCREQRVRERESDGKSDRWEMSTLWRSKVPQVWTPIIYRQSSYPCQRAVSLCADLSLLWPGRPDPSTAQCTFSLSLSLPLFFSSFNPSTSVQFSPLAYLLHFYPTWPVLCHLRFNIFSLYLILLFPCWVVNDPIVMFLMISHICKPCALWD